MLLVEDYETESVINKMDGFNANVITLTVGDELSGQIAQYVSGEAHDDQGNAIAGEAMVAADAEGNVVVAKAGAAVDADGNVVAAKMVAAGDAEGNVEAIAAVATSDDDDSDESDDSEENS